jgi:hypothetical protein
MPLPSLILKLDRLFLHGKLARRSREHREDTDTLMVQHSFEYQFVVSYNKHPQTLLSDLCDKYGSDKGSAKTSGHPYPWHPHTYTDFYSRLFDHCRLDVKKVFECGLGTNDPSLLSSMGEHGKPGASLRVWRDYFPNAQIYGADIDKHILFSEHRITTFFVDQTSPSTIGTLWDNAAVSDFDFMIDDGLHTFEAGVCLFEHSFSKLATGGIYVIEDVKSRDLPLFQEYFSRTSYNVEFVNLSRRNTRIPWNSLIVVRQL